MKVEDQIAIIFCGTNNLLRKVPTNRVNDFQQEFLHHLEERFAPTLKLLKEGKYTDEITSTLKKVAAELAAKYDK